MLLNIKNKQILCVNFIQLILVFYEMECRRKYFEGILRTMIACHRLRKYCLTNAFTLSKNDDLNLFEFQD